MFSNLESVGQPENKGVRHFSITGLFDLDNLFGWISAVSPIMGKYNSGYPGYHRSGLYTEFRAGSVHLYQFTGVKCSILQLYD